MTIPTRTQVKKELARRRRTAEQAIIDELCEQLFSNGCARLEGCEYELERIASKFRKKRWTASVLSDPRVTSGLAGYVLNIPARKPGDNLD